MGNCKRILFVSSGNSKFGISPIVKNQGESLINKGIHVEFFTIKGKGIFSYIRSIHILRCQIKENKFDLVHAHYSYSAFTATLANCKPLIVSLMGSDVRGNVFLKWAIRFFNKTKWRAVIVKSESMKLDIGLKKPFIIPNGVNIELITKTIKPSKPFESNIILFASDPTRVEKNFSLAEKAASRLSDKKVVLKTVFGIQHDKLLSEIKNASVVLLTSFYEGSPNIIKEAMALNIPIVSTNVGDVAWIFGETEGCYLTSFDFEDVADKLKLALNFAKEKGKTNGLDRIIKLGLDDSTIASRLISIYETVIANEN